MSAQQRQIMPIKPVATVQAGGLWESINGGLSNALDIWGKVEQIKGQKSASGQDQIQAMYKPELANGAAIQVDAPLAKDTSGGFKVDKTLLLVSGGVLALAFLLRMKGFK